MILCPGLALGLSCLGEQRDDRETAKQSVPTIDASEWMVTKGDQFGCRRSSQVETRWWHPNPCSEPEAGFL